MPEIASTELIIKRLMKYQKVGTVYKLSEVSGIPQSTFSYWRRRDTVDLKVIFSKFPNVSPSWLLYGVGCESLTELIKLHRNSLSIIDVVEDEDIKYRKDTTENHRINDSYHAEKSALPDFMKILDRLLESMSQINELSARVSQLEKESVEK